SAIICLRLGEVHMLKTILSLACNLAIVIWTAASVVHSAKRVDEATGQITAARTFRYFTTDSNLLAAAASLLLILLEARSLLSGQFALPAWALLVKLVGTAAVSVTLLTVLVFLGPSAGYGLLS
ncbi:MAG TPA: hypothetical protein PLS83_12650, partial [Methanothrix soehngenii]|nr:hypothetical protein [Methanothrix soehngenii]